MSFLFAYLTPAGLRPTRKHPQDAGVDVYAADSNIIWPFSAKPIPTGVTVAVPEGHALLVWPKSRSDHLIGAGVIDAGYQGEIMVKIVNYRPWPIRIKKGSAVAQLVRVPVTGGQLVEVPVEEIHRTRTERGSTGGILGNSTP